MNSLSPCILAGRVVAFSHSRPRFTAGILTLLSAIGGIFLGLHIAFTTKTSIAPPYAPPMAPTCHAGGVLSLNHDAGRFRRTRSKTQKRTPVPRRVGAAFARRQERKCGRGCADGRLRRKLVGREMEPARAPVRKKMVCRDVEGMLNALCESLRVGKARDVESMQELERKYRRVLAAGRLRDGLRETTFCLSILSYAGPRSF